MNEMRDHGKLESRKGGERSGRRRNGVGSTSRRLMMTSTFMMIVIITTMMMQNPWGVVVAEAKRVTIAPKACAMESARYPETVRYTVSYSTGGSAMDVRAYVMERKWRAKCFPRLFDQEECTQRAIRTTSFGEQSVVNFEQGVKFDEWDESYTVQLCNFDGSKALIADFDAVWDRRWGWMWLFFFLIAVGGLLFLLLLVTIMKMLRLQRDRRRRVAEKKARELMRHEMNLASPSPAVPGAISLPWVAGTIIQPPQPVTPVVCYPAVPAPSGARVGPRVLTRTEALPSSSSIERGHLAVDRTINV
jgi:hypothetical protein